jgi:[ribosomal protein S5]-alanine N-acetyltransferase
LSPKHWGIGKQILNKLIDWSFTKFNLDTILILLPDTRKSFKAIQKYGFEYYGIENFHNEVFHKFKMNKNS